MSYMSFKPAYAKSEPIELTPAHIALVRANLDLVASDQNASFKSQQQYDMPLIHFSMTFYNKLFTIIPEARPLFKKPLEQQGNMLTKTVAMSVKMLDNVQDLVPALQRLAARHVAYGSTLEQYGAVGEALLYALEQVSGTQWNAAVADAWVTVYSLMLSVMIPAQVEADAAKKAKAAAAAATANGASAVANGL